MNELDIPAIVIPHGNTWGFYSPPNISWDKQLTKDFNDENLQIIIEVDVWAWKFRRIQALEGCYRE